MTIIRSGSRTRGLVALGALALVASACSSSGDSNDAEGGQAGAVCNVDSMEIVTAPTGSSYFPLGGAIANRLEEALDIPVTASPSAGSGENVGLLQDGTVELALVAANNLGPAYEGTGPFEKKYDKLRAIAHLYPNGILVYAKGDSGIETIADLEGKRVGVGAEARTWDHFMEPLFVSQGVSYDDMEPVYAGFDDMVRQVRDGQLDAAIATGGADAPSAGFLELATSVDVRVLSWDEASLADAIGSENVYSYPADVLEGTVEGDTYETADIGGPYLTTTTDLSDECVSEIASVFYDNVDSIADEVAVLKWASEQDVSNLVKPLGDVPYHDGATSFWKSIDAIE